MRTPDYAPRTAQTPGVKLPAPPPGAQTARVVIYNRGWRVVYRVANNANAAEAFRITGGYSTQFRLRPGRGPIFGPDFIHQGGPTNLLAPGENREFAWTPSMTGGSGYIDVPVHLLGRAGGMIYPFSAGGFVTQWLDGSDAGPAEILSETCWYEFETEYV